MSDYAQNVSRLKAGGFSQDEIDDYSAQQLTKLQAGGFSQDEIADYLGITKDDDPDLLGPIQSYWESVSNETKRRFTALQETVSGDIESTGEAIVGAAMGSRR